MKIIQSFLILTIAILGFSFVDVEAKNVNDKDTKTVEQQVTSQIRKLLYYGVFDIISFEIDGSTVVLSGKVHNAVNRKSAERRIKKIAGVEKVINDIEVLPASNYDNAIRFRTVRAFSRTGNIYRYLQGPNPSMRIIVENGHITLAGYVRSKGDSKLANILANTVAGTFSVTNNLIVSKEFKL